MHGAKSSTQDVFWLSQGPTWQQAVQWIQEKQLAAGSQMNLVTKHDTYSISFAWPAGSDDSATGPAAILHDQNSHSITAAADVFAVSAAALQESAAGQNNECGITTELISATSRSISDDIMAGTVEVDSLGANDMKQISDSTCDNGKADITGCGSSAERCSSSAGDMHIAPSQTSARSDAGAICHSQAGQNVLKVTHLLFHFDPRVCRDCSWPSPCIKSFVLSSFAKYACVLRAANEDCQITSVLIKLHEGTDIDLVIAINGQPS